MKLTIHLNGDTILKGGPGSGNKGHAGIPGHQGGSAPTGTAAPAKTTDGSMGTKNPGLANEIARHNERMMKDGVRVSGNYSQRTGRSEWFTISSRPGMGVSFNTPEEADLWMNEILGQLSDGKYENRWGRELAEVYALQVKVDPSKPTQFKGVQYGPRLSFTDLASMYGETDPSDPRGRYDQKTAKRLFSSITKAYSAARKPTY